MDDYDVGLPSSPSMDEGILSMFEDDDGVEFENDDGADFGDDIFDGEALVEDKMNEIINEDTDGGTIELAHGMEFGDVYRFRDALKEWSISRGFEYTCVKNERSRVRAICKVSKECPFLVHASVVGGESTFQIKTWNPIHTCPRQDINNLITSKYLSKKLLEDFRSNPQEEMSGLKNRVSKSVGYDVGIQRLYRARKKAKKTIFGDHARQFEVSRAYSEIILSTNPGSFVKLHTEPQPPIMIDGFVKELLPRFQRLYVSFHAMIAGFTAGCRPIIGLDGCFLKTHFGGHLLSAIAHDGNNGMFPIAIVVVEAENKDSWSWFLTSVLDALGGIDPTNLVFISDMQKGLLQSFADLFPHTEHRYCLNHLLDNYKKQFKGKLYTDLLWQAAYATTENGFETAMKKLQNVDAGKAYDYLKRLNPNKWSRSHFSFKAKSDLLVNNISESFNSRIVQARELPIISMVDWIRKKLMKSLYDRKTNMEQYIGPITPKIQERLEKLKTMSRDCIASPSSQYVVEVTCRGKSFSTNIEKKCCSCRVWGLTGIPCIHGIATIRYWRRVPEDFVDICFSTETYMKVYSTPIKPIPDLHDYLAKSESTVAAPVIKKPPGRPKILRRRQADEPRNPYKNTRTNQPIRCGNCRAEGHNARNCKASVIGETPSQRMARIQNEQSQQISQPSTNRKKMATRGGKHIDAPLAPDEGSLI